MLLTSSSFALSLHQVKVKWRLNCNTSQQQIEAKSLMRHYEHHEPVQPVQLQPPLSKTQEWTDLKVIHYLPPFITLISSLNLFHFFLKLFRRTFVWLLYTVIPCTPRIPQSVAVMVPTAPMLRLLVTVLGNVRDSTKCAPAHFSSVPETVIWLALGRNYTLIYLYKNLHRADQGRKSTSGIV